MGKLVLINSIPTDFPIYTCSISLAPKKVMQEITKEIRKILQQGGKSNGLKKFHLVNWDTVCSPKIYGGAGIRDSNLMNITLGEKILWTVVSGKKKWWKEILWKKIHERNKEKVYG